DRNRSHWSTSKTPSYTKSVSWQHHRKNSPLLRLFNQITRFYKISRKLQHLLMAIISCEVITLSSNIQT
ncbi:hypothetical protein, partial [Escherichia coli]|uniref:hypothetical protein n=1 Tax=Escherichia coli TaxID=562 RepID=UPI00313BF7CB